MEYVPIREMAEQLGMEPKNCRAYLLSRGFVPTKIRTKETHGQLTLALSREEFERLRETRRREGFLHMGTPVEVDAR